MYATKAIHIFCRKCGAPPGLGCGSRFCKVRVVEAKMRTQKLNSQVKQLYLENKMRRII